MAIVPDRQILADRLRALEELQALLDRRMGDLEAGLTIRLNTLGSKTETVRSSRVLQLAARSAARIRNLEARVLYTAADIEISRMNDTLGSLQEAVE